MLEAVARRVPVAKLAGHYHDTYGRRSPTSTRRSRWACACSTARSRDSGGCPYAKGATGNVATEDVVYMLDGMGIATGVDLDKLLDAAEFICDALGRPTTSRAGRALMAKRAVVPIP